MNSLPPSLPSYKPPIFTTVAHALKSVRADAWTTAQLWALDQAIERLCDDLEEQQPRFSRELFCRNAGYRMNIIEPDRR
jgi:hypothetical protein